VVRDAGRMRLERMEDPEENANGREATRVWKDFKACFSLATCIGARRKHLMFGPFDGREPTSLCGLEGR
jgi:hypothetical protein